MSLSLAGVVLAAIFATSSRAAEPAFNVEEPGFWTKGYGIPDRYETVNIMFEAKDPGALAEKIRKRLSGLGVTPESVSNNAAVYHVDSDTGAVVKRVMAMGEITGFNKSGEELRPAYPELRFKRDILEKERVLLGDALSPAVGIKALLGVELKALDALIRSQESASRGISLRISVAGLGESPPSFPGSSSGFVRRSKYARKIMRRVIAGQPLGAPDSPQSVIYPDPVDFSTSTVDEAHWTRSDLGSPCGYWKKDFVRFSVAPADKDRFREKLARAYAAVGGIDGPEACRNTLGTYEQWIPEENVARLKIALARLGQVLAQEEGDVHPRSEAAAHALVKRELLRDELKALGRKLEEAPAIRAFVLGEIERLTPAADAQAQTRGRLPVVVEPR